MKSLRESLLDDVDVVSDKLNTPSLIEAWLKKWDRNHCCFVNKDNTISGRGVFILENYNEEELPEYIQFKYINGSFCIVGGDLKTLRGCPKKVKLSFELKYVKGIKDLKYAPEIAQYVRIGGCDNLESLEGCPDNLETFHCMKCNKLKNLEGGPTKVRVLYNCEHNLGLESLKGAPARVQSFYCEGCDNLKNLDYKPNCLRGFVPEKFR